MTDFDPNTPPLLQALRAGPVGVSSPDEVTRARSDMMPWLEAQVMALPQKRALHMEAQKRRRIWAAGGALAVAAGALLAFTGLIQSEGRSFESAFQDTKQSDGRAFATLVSGKVMSGSVDLLVGSRLGLSSRVQTSEERGAVLQASSGFEVALSPATDVAFLPEQENASGQDKRLRLHRGSVSLSVAPLPKGSSLSVVTEDAVVTVVGTRFSVEHQPGEISCVRVLEGKVQVKRKTETRLLGAGAQWGCEKSVEAGRTEKGHGVSGEAQGRAMGTTLDKESELLSRALSHERKGERKQALRAYQDLIRRYPASGFAPDARAGIARVSSESQDPGASPR